MFFILPFEMSGGGPGPTKPPVPPKPKPGEKT